LTITPKIKKVKQTKKLYNISYFGIFAQSKNFGAGETAVASERL
jgi:hypothetical protein